MNEIQNTVVECAERAVVTLMPRTGDKLDFSLGSLLLVDELLMEAAPHIEALPEEQVTGFVQQLGCYVLEVARRDRGGEYFWDESRQEPVLVVGEPEKHVALMVWGKVRERMHAKDEAYIPLHVLAFVEHVKKAPDGDETLFQ